PLIGELSTFPKQVHRRPGPFFRSAVELRFGYLDHPAELIRSLRMGRRREVSIEAASTTWHSIP
ncbi:MAG: hypothetical protein WB611_12780, partial [Stellaceae bacterium]